MKLKFAHVVLIALLVLIEVLFLSVSHSSKGTQGPEVSGGFAAELSARAQVVEDYNSALMAIVEKTGDSRAAADLRLVKEKGLIVVPADDGVVYDQSRDYENSVKIAPILSSDAKFPIWKTILDEESSGAKYNPEMKLLILKGELRFSSVYKGAIAAHEYDHVRNDFTNPGRILNAQNIAEEEADEFAFHNSLIAKMGGDAYVAILKEEISRLYAAMKENDGGISLPEAEYNSRLDAVFGPPMSSNERDFRAATLRIDAAFHIFDTAPSKERAAQMKVSLMKTWYESIGISSPAEK